MKIMTPGPADDSAVSIERHGRVAHLVLRRPAKLNALDLKALATIREAISDVDRDYDVRAVVVRGEGRAFCAGVDLDLTSDALADAEHIDRIVSDVHLTFSMIEACRVPVIAAVHGMAVAGGLELVLSCDLAIAARGCRLGDFHARYGLFPGGGSSQRLPRIIGERRAKWLLLSGELISAEVAAEWGLVNEVVDPDRLLERSNEMAELLARRSPLLANAIKNTVRVGADVELSKALLAERPLFLRYMSSEDARRGLDAFRDRSEPEFIGR